jgi:endonuclease G
MAFRADLAIQAAERWGEVPANPQPLESLLVSHGESVELRDQRQKRVARLGQIASAAKAQALALAADASPQATATQADVLSTVGQERIIGNSDLLGVDFLELAISISRAIGRVRCGNIYATGVLIGPRLMMTNNHVIGEKNNGDGWKIEMDYQRNSSGEMMAVHTYDVDPSLFFYTNPTLDYTIVGMGNLSDRKRPIAAYGWVKLVADTGKIEVGDPINIIQHPEGDLKQIAFRENKVIALTNAKPDFLDYTTDTQEGSSGSGCFNDQWELVALHHSSIPRTDAENHILTKSAQVWKQGQSTVDIEWIGNEGVRVSAIVKDLTTATLPAPFAPLVDNLLKSDPPNPIELARMRWDQGSVPTAPAPTPDVPVVPVQPNTPGALKMSDGSVSIQIPLTITVSLGGGSATATQTVAAPTVPASDKSTYQPAPPPTPVPAEEAVVIDQDWKARLGYLPNFLGDDQIVPLPILTTEQLKVTAQIDPNFRVDGSQYKDYELRYWNYSVLLNGKYRTAWFSAANVDGDERYQMPPRKGDKWFQDKRAPLNQQLDQTAFETGIDRGHLTRREDAAWGKTQGIATKSTNDTFHFTNCSLQASPFNRGKDRWQGLEQFLLEQHAKKEKRRMIVITGPVFDPKNPTYRNDKMDYSVPCPLQFWKICVLIRQDDTMSSTGFILGQQDIAQLPGFEKFDVGAAQVTLEQLQKKTNLKFDQKLINADNFAKTNQPGALEKFVDGEKHRFISNFNEIVV